MDRNVIRLLEDIDDANHDLSWAKRLVKIWALVAVGGVAAIILGTVLGRMEILNGDADLGLIIPGTFALIGGLVATIGCYTNNVRDAEIQLRKAQRRHRKATIEC